MRKTTKKLLTVMCSLAATACLSVGGVYALSQTTRAQADATTGAELVDFTVDGVGNTHNHFFYTDGAFYQLTLDFNQSGLAFNAHASAVSGITFNGVPMTCGGAPSGDSIMVITLGSGLWIHYTAEQATAWYKNYSHPTIHFEEGATVTDANGTTMTYAELTLYLVDGAWTATMPEGYQVGTTNATFVDFTVDGVGNTHNHFSNGNYYQLTLDFNKDGLAFNQFATAVKGITFNGVEVKSGEAPNGDLISLVTLNSGLWIWYTAEQASPNYKGYSHPTIQFENGATVTDANGTTITYANLTLYLVNGTWTTVKPQDYGIIDNVNYAPDFISIGDFNHVYSEGLVAYGVSLKYDTTGFTADGNMETALSASGFSMNGEDIGVAFSGGNQVLLWLVAGKCVSNYNGYSHPTIVVKEGAKATNMAGKEFTLGGATLYLVDGAWTTTKPEGYYVEKPKAVFVDFTVEGVGNTHNHFFYTDGAFYQLTLDFNQSGLAFNAHASAVSGITFNGVPMTCGNTPSGDSIMVLTLDSGLWIHYTAEQANPYYKGYSHPTIQFESGATVMDANGETMKYADLTLYLVDGAWTTEKPDGYKIVEPAKDTTFTYLGKTAETNNSNRITLYYNDENEWTDDEGTLADKVMLDGVSLRSIGGNVTKGERSLTIAWTGEYTTLTIVEEATFAGQNIPQMTLYLNDGEWSFIDSSKEATVSCSGPASGAWDNVELDGSEGYSTNVFKFSEAFVGGVDKTNQAASVAYSVATGMKINGVTFYEMYLQDQNTRIDYDHGHNYLQFIFPKEYLENTDGEYPVLTIEKGTTFMGQVLPACQYILYGGHWLNAESFDPTPLSYNGIAPSWNNAISSGVSNTILQFGEYGVDFLGPDNGSKSHADPTNLANPALKAPIATAMTIDGKTMAELYEQDNRVQVTYAHGYNYFYIAIPEYMLAKDGYGCVTLHIEDKTVFVGCVLSEVTLYLYEGEWTSIKPDVVEGEDAEYTTISELFEENTKALHAKDSIESAISANNNMIYSFLLKNDSIANTVIFSTHYTTEYDGIKVVFMGDASTGSETIRLFVNGKEMAMASYMWTESEWFAVRITVDVGETLSVSVAIDGVYFIKATDIPKDGLGTKIGVQNESGNNTLCDYKVGDIKKPTIYWQGKEVYYYALNAEKPADSLFQSVVDVMDNKDGAIDEGELQVIWQDGAVTDGKLNEGTWTVTISIADTAGNIAQYTVTVIVEDADKVTVTFDGVKTDAIYHIGDFLSEPTAPTKAGYTFEGWYVGNVKWDFVNNVVTGDLALTSKFIKVETTYTVVVASEGLGENYVYTFKLAQGATLDQSILIRDGYIYKLYVDGTEVQTIIVQGDANYTAVYTEVQDAPIVPPDDSSDIVDSSVEEDVDDESSSDLVINPDGGCFGVASLGGMGLTVLISSAVLMMKKRKED